MYIIAKFFLFDLKRSFFLMSPQVAGFVRFFPSERISAVFYKSIYDGWFCSVFSSQKKVVVLFGLPGM